MEEIIFKILERKFNIERKEFLKKDRKDEHVYIRQLFYYLMRKHSKLSLAKIGEFTNQGYAIVLYSDNLIKDRMFYYKEHRQLINSISREIIIMPQIQKYKGYSEITHCSNGFLI